MLPPTLALVEPDSKPSHPLVSHLHERGVRVERFHSGSDLLVHPAPFDFDFYVIDLALEGPDGLDLVRLLRRRTQVGLVVTTSRPVPEVFDAAMTAGADMVLWKPISPAHVALALEAVQRRCAASRLEASSWKLDRRAHELVAPDGARIALGEPDLVLLECFAEARGGVVTRDTLMRRLKVDPTGRPDKTLNAIVYRLRKRIGRATPAIVPLQSQSRVGYTFRAALALG